MSLKRKFVRFDDRTGRLERAVNIINDGQNKNLHVARGEADKFNPQTNRLRVGLDRVAIRGKDFTPEIIRGPARIDVGWNANSNFERQGVPSCVFGTTWGYLTYTDTSGGYGMFGFGEYGYGGLVDDTTERKF